MARRKTRKTTKKKRRNTRARKPAAKASPGMFNSIAAGTVIVAAKVLRAATPSKETLGALWTTACSSRGVRRAAGVGGGVVVLALVSWIMLENLRTDERYTVDPGRIELSAQPSWAKDPLARRIKQEIEAELRADLADLQYASAFDDDVMAIVQERMEANPWVRRVIRIERRFPTGSERHSRLLPVMEIRTPAVAIVAAERFVLIDGESVVLPMHLDEEKFHSFNAQMVQPLRIVRGVADQPPTAGEVWNSEQVSAAISMERVIRRAELDSYPGIEAIELFGIPRQADPRGRVHYQPDGGIVLIPDQEKMPGTRLVWGRPPVHASTLELSPNDKLDQLRSKLREMDTVANTRIDLRHRS